MFIVVLDIIKNYLQNMVHELRGYMFVVLVCFFIGIPYSYLNIFGFFEKKKKIKKLSYNSSKNTIYIILN